MVGLASFLAGFLREKNERALAAGLGGLGLKQPFAVLSRAIGLKAKEGGGKDGEGRPDRGLSKPVGPVI